MSTCSECGAVNQDGAQCGRCGAFLDTEHSLELEVSVVPVVREHHGATVELASGAPGGESTPTGAERLPTQASTLPSPRLHSGGRSFAERMKAERLVFWRATRIPIIAVLAWFTASWLLFDATWVFVDNVNLLLHEGGHWVFRPFGTTIYALGGTLMQLLMPAAFTAYFGWWRRDRFATLAALWWVGENLFGIARYVADAPFEELPLVGGDTHDWNFLFGRWGLISSAQDIAHVTKYLGAAITLACLAGMARIAWKPTNDEIESTDREG